MENIEISITGSSYSGKSCLAKALAGKDLNLNYMAIPSIDLLTKRISDKGVNLRIWDLSGDESYNSIITMCIKKSKYVLLTYAATDWGSYTKMVTLYESYWRKRILDGKTIIIVATKMDIRPNSAYKRGEDYANRIGASYIEVSALDGLGIAELQDMLCDGVIQPIITYKSRSCNIM